MTRREVIEVKPPDLPPGRELSETSNAKDEVAWYVTDLLGWYGIDDTHPLWHDAYDSLALANRIVEQLIELGWRPTKEVEDD